MWLFHSSATAQHDIEKNWASNVFWFQFGGIKVSDDSRTFNAKIVLNKIFGYIKTSISNRNIYESGIPCFRVQPAYGATISW